MPPKTPDAEIFELQARLARLRAYHFGYERQQLPPTAEHWRLRNDIGEEVQQLLQDLFARHAQQARLQEIQAGFQKKVPDRRWSWP